MALATSTSLSHATSSFINGETKSLSSFSQLRNHHFHLPSSKNANFTKQLVIYAKRLSGLEEALRIRRERELRGSTTAKRRPPLRRGRVSQRLPVPDDIPKPPYVGSRELPEIAKEHQIHDAEGLARMRAACELAARVVDYAGTLVRPSVTTNEIDKAVHQMIIDAGAYPSPLGYGGFPKSVCTSVNECMCHGIPDSRQLQDGDIINIDVTVYLNGYHGDTSKTFFCGDVSESIKRLVKVTEECLHYGIAVCKDGALFRKIGKRISEHAEKFGYGVVDRFVGHGIGTVFHSEPLIFHHRNDKSGSMVEGQTFTIEPILTLGSTECVTWEDNWTTLTADGSPAAQFEHTILITKTVIYRERELRGSTTAKRRPPLRRGRVSQRLPVPDDIPKPPYVGSRELPEIAKEHQIHDAEGLARMRAACELAARVVDYAGTLVRPSVTTNEIDKAVHQMIIDAGAYPSPLGYGGFPKSVCTSVNECMCHGIPDSRQLQDGDIINIDVTVYLNGYHGDTSKTFFCGDVSESIKRLVKVTEECLHYGIAVCKDGALFRKIGKRISEHAEKFGYGVVDRFVGHGIGTVFHSEPLIFHHRNDKSGSMVEGQTFTIEPILTLGSTECVTWEDNWTTLTADGSPAAQFEHTILITKTGAEILTTY